MVVRRCPTLPHPGGCSTIGAVGLSFRVRDGTGRFPHAVAAVTLAPRTRVAGWGSVWSRCCVRELCSVVLVVLLVSLGFVVWGPYGGRVAWLVLPVPCRARCGAVGVWCVEVVGLLVPVGFASRWSSLPRPAYQPSGLLGASPTLGGWRSHLEAGFPLRCFQRLSHPNVANQRCTWQYN